MQGPTWEFRHALKWWPLLSTRLWFICAGALQVHVPAAGTHAPALLAAFAERYAVAEMYQAYALIHKAAHEPFHSIFGATLFNAARFLLMRLLQVSPGAVWQSCPAASCAMLHTIRECEVTHASCEACCCLSRCSHSVSSCMAP